MVMGSMQFRNTVHKNRRRLSGLPMLYMSRPISTAQQRPSLECSMRVTWCFRSCHLVCAGLVSTVRNSRQSNPPLSTSSLVFELNFSSLSKWPRDRLSSTTPTPGFNICRRARGFKRLARTKVWETWDRPFKIHHMDSEVEGAASPIRLPVCWIECLLFLHEFNQPAPRYRSLSYRNE